MKPEQMNDDMLVKYLLGEASKAEETTVANWLAESAANRKHYNDFKLIWDQSKKLEPELNIDTNAAWQRFTQRIEQEQQPELQQVVTPTRITIPFYRQTGYRAAAAIILLLGIGSFIYLLNRSSEPAMQWVSSGEKTITDTLPDGSVVVLNKHSTLSYPAVFNGNNRPVTLKGEGFFAITPNKAKPFVIDANNTSITVVGTTFNVKTSESRTEVIVETGIVEVAKRTNTVRITHHQKAIVAGDNAPVTEENKDGLYSYYRTGEFVCNNTPLYKLASILNEAYNVQISFSDEEIGGRLINTTFHDEPIEEIVDVICQTLNLKANKNGRAIILSDR